MKTRLDAEKIIKTRQTDLALVVLTIIVAGTGLAILFSASYAYADRFFSSPYYFLFRQALFYIPGIVVLVFCAFVDLEWVRSKIMLITLLTLLLQLFPYLPFIGMEKNGAHRWVNLGFSLQPSEVLKPVIVLYLAHIFAKKNDKTDDVVNTVAPPLLISGLACVLVLVQNDFSTAMLIASICALMFFAAGIPLRFFAMLASVAIPLAILSVLTSEYRFERIITFLFPEHDPSGLAFQISGALKAVQAGGILGLGPGMGVLKIASIPEVHADFVFAAFTEELGFVGVLAFLSLWVCYLGRGLFVTLKKANSGDLFQYYVGIGSVCVLAFQCLINLGVTAGVLPATGIALPFVSAGGSSLIISCAIAGIIINISRTSNKEEVNVVNESVNQGSYNSNKYFSKVVNHG